MMVGGFMNKHNILITGIAGQIGSRLSSKLTEMGLEHMGIDREEYTGSAKFMRCDLTTADENDLNEFVGQATHIIHLADEINDTQNFESEFLDQVKNCCYGTMRLLNSANSNLRHFSFASSYSVYGTPTSVPLIEHSSIPNPENVYSFSKLISENYLSMYNKNNNIPIAILRISSVYGPGAKRKNFNRSIPNMIETVLNGRSPYVVGSGMTYRDYLFLDDCVNAIYNSSVNLVHGVYNIASGSPTSTKEIAQSIVSISGKDIDIEYKKENKPTWSAVCDITKMQSDIDYFPVWSLFDGLLKTYEWHKGLRE